MLTSSKDDSGKIIDLRMDKVLNYGFKHSDYHNSCEYNHNCFANYG